MFMFLTTEEKKEDSQSIVDTLVPGKTNERKQTIRVAHDPAIPLRISGVTRSNEFRFEQIQF